jgi:hypothetical protein
MFRPNWVILRQRTCYKEFFTALLSDGHFILPFAFAASLCCWGEPLYPPCALY